MSTNNTGSLLNRAALRRYILASAVKLRPHHEFTRVGAGFLDAIEGAVRNAVTAKIQAHPSKGKTLSQ